MMTVRGQVHVLQSRTNYNAVGSNNLDSNKKGPDDLLMNDPGLGWKKAHEKFDDVLIVLDPYPTLVVVTPSSYKQIRDHEKE